MALENHVLDLIPAYALSALDETEALAVQAHLETCARCQAEVEAYEEVAGLLPLAAPRSAPPAHLKDAILNSLEPAGKPRMTPAQPSALAWLSAFFHQPGRVWALVSLLAVLALAASNLALWQEVQRLQSTQAQALQVVVLDGTDLVPQATGSMVIGRDGLVGTLVVDGLPPLDENHEYQLWFVEDGKRTSGGLFSVSDEGYGSLYIHAPQPVRSLSGLGVTVEPAGGSPGPTGDKVLGVDF
jgi:anti-sigma-K factor RskA